MVNSRNIEMKKFSGESGSKLTYLEFNENLKEFISIKGRDGDVLNRILTWAENQGEDAVSIRELEQFEKKVPKILEYDRVVHSALKNWTDGDAKRLLKYEVKVGVDAWRMMCIEYVPLAQTKQDIILIEILDLKPVTEKNVRKLLSRIEELRYKYNQCGGTPLGENIIKIMLVKCIPKEIMKPLALHLEGSTAFQQARKLIMRQMHDELTGMLEGEATQPLYNLEKAEKEAEEDEDAGKKAEEEWNKLEQDYWTVVLNKGKGGTGGKGEEGKGKGRGYGECWNCGAQGHPARECPFPGKLHSGVDAANKGSAVAFKGKKTAKRQRQLERKRLER